MDRNIDFEENSPYQKGIILKLYERLEKSYIQEPSELKDLIDITKLVQKFLPKQPDIDKILDIIKRKVLKGIYLPLTIKEIQAGYLTSPYFKDLYLYLAQNKVEWWLDANAFLDKHQRWGHGRLHCPFILHRMFCHVASWGEGVR